jgi:hypothetical protein
MTNQELKDKVRFYNVSKEALNDGIFIPYLQPQIANLIDVLIDERIITLPQATEPTPEFLAFWDVYPRKAGKANAWKAWGKVKASLPTIMDALRRYIAIEWEGKELQYIPHAATWLNQKRYYEEPEAPGTIATDPEAQARLDKAQAEFENRRLGICRNI